MASTRLDQAKAFVAATITSRKETDRIESLTGAILSKYKSIPGPLGSIGSLLGIQARISTAQNKASQEQILALREIKSEQIQIARLRDLELDKISTIQERLSRTDISATQRRNLTLQLTKAELAAGALEARLDGVNQRLLFTQKVAIPAENAINSFIETKTRVDDIMRFSGLGKMLSISAEINKALIRSNSSLMTRNQLLQTGLRVAASTGVSMKTMTEAQQSLVDLGFDLRDTYEETLKITVQLVDGLGMSASEAANLAVIARTTNSQFKDLSNTISAIVDTTALAADEAARYARELAVASRVAIGSGRSYSSGSFDQNLKVVSQLEGAMKGTIAVQGDIAQMLAKFTSFQQKGGMGLAFGTGGLGFLSQDQNSARRVMLNIARTVKDANGIMLEAYAGMLDTNKETLAALGQLYREKGEEMFDIPPEMQERANLERRYREQIAQQGEAFRLLGDKLRFLGAKAIGPLLTIANATATGIVWLAQKFEDTRVIAIPAMAAVSAAVIASTVKMTKALWQFTAQTLAVARALSVSHGLRGAGGQATVSAADALGGALVNRVKKGAVGAGAEAVGGTVMRGFLGRIFGGIAGLFSGTALRGLLGRGLAFISSIFLTGGWSLVAGLVVSLVAQFLPNIISLIKGKGWSGDAGVKRNPDEDRTMFSRTIYARAEGLAMEIATQDRSMLVKKLKMLEEDLYAEGSGATSADLASLRKMVAEAATREIISFAGQAQRSQGIDLAKDNENVETLKAMRRSTEELNRVLTTFTENFIKIEQDKARREQTSKEEKARSDAARAKQLSEWAANNLSVPHY